MILTTAEVGVTFFASSFVLILVPYLLLCLQLRISGRVKRAIMQRLLQQQVMIFTQLQLLHHLHALSAREEDGVGVGRPSMMKKSDSFFGSSGSEAITKCWTAIISAEEILEC